MTMLELTDERRRAVLGLVDAWLAQRGGAQRGGAPAGAGEAVAVAVRQVEVLRDGRPGLLDVVAEVGDRVAHAVLGVRRPGEEAHLLRASDDPVLGLFDDEHGLGVVVDALRDAELAPLVLSTVAGGLEDPAPPAAVADDDEAVVLAFGACTLTVFPWLDPGPHPGVELLVALDEAGFNHLPAPLAIWRRGGLDLGVVQELLAGSAGGWALALTSLRDLYASGGAPERAGGDFGPEARDLGTMTARMHLALDRAFGRQTERVADWALRAEAVVREADPALLEVAGAGQALAALRESDLRAPALRTHGDFHLGRTARTDQGWVLADCLRADDPAGDGAPGHRSPLADVADLLWSLHRAATEAAFERDPTGRAGLATLAQAWEARNRRAFLAGYLATPGIGGLVPTDRAVVRDLAAVFELERAARLTLADRRPAGPPSAGLPTGDPASGDPPTR